MQTLIAVPTVLTGLPLYDTVISNPESGLDERMVAALICFGWMEQSITPSGELAVVPTPAFVEWLGLNEIGVHVEGGQWVNEAMEECEEDCICLPA